MLDADLSIEMDGRDLQLPVEIVREIGKPEKSGVRCWGGRDFEPPARRGDVENWEDENINMKGGKPAWGECAG